MNRVKKLEDDLRKLSPLKHGLKVKNEDDPLADYNKMTTKIYLGNQDTAKNKKFFREKKIRAVLNCSKDISNYFTNDNNVEYMRIPIDDSLKEIDFKKMYNFFPAIVEFIYKHADIEKHNVFIHCAAGKQRSISAFCAYLMAKKRFSVKKACAYALQKRLEAFHFGTSLNFSKSLIKFEDTLKKKKC
jgi:protein-tyrosine phosphatase